MKKEIEKKYFSKNDTRMLPKKTKFNLLASVGVSTKCSDSEQMARIKYQFNPCEIISNNYESKCSYFLKLLDLISNFNVFRVSISVEVSEVFHFNINTLEKTSKSLIGCPIPTALCHT